MRILRPDLIGLPDLEHLPPEARAEPLTTDMLFHLLKEGHAARARGLIAAAYLDGTPPAALFDGPVAASLHRLGELWKTEQDGIFREHRATSVCLEAVSQLGLLIPPPPDDAPLALGGAAEHDPYLLPTTMAATVLADAGYRIVNLGAHTPASAFLHAAATHHPRLVWMALRNTLTPSRRAALVEEGIQPLLEQGIAVVLGGQGADAAADAWPDAALHLHSMEELAAFARQNATSV